MKSKLLKKSFSIILTVVMLLTMVPATVFAAESELPMMMQFTAASSADFHKYYNKVYTVTFLDEIDDTAMNGALEKWDISANSGSGEVMAWMYINTQATAAAGDKRYDVYIAGEGGVAANPQSGFIFYLFSELTEVNGSENFKTDTAVSFKSMFENCYKLTKASFKGWNTENVTSLENMFRNCSELSELDLSSFNTSKVTTMRFMFYLCKKLKNIYVGDGWTTESITNLFDGVFNCCYAIIGGTDDDKLNQEIYESNPNPPISNHYAVLKEDGGYFDYKAPEAPAEYTVSYEFVGDVLPDGVTAPDSYTYNEGSKISVAASPSAEGYVFSGWTTADAIVENGEFTVNNDVHFVGSWSKLYTVTYVYKDGYEVPEGAPELPAVAVYEAGDWVDTYGVPYVDRYLFMGWTTDDADVAGDMFIMPENDVVFYGYFKIPVESVEFTNDGDIVLNKDEEEKLYVYIKPEDATIKDVVYTSSDESVVTVDKYGKITAKGEGTATVTVSSSDDPTKSDTVTVNVKIPVTELIVDPADVTLRNGEEKTLDVYVNGDATNKEVTFESNDENVARVDENGKITATGDGETTVVVTSKDDPSKKVTVKVTVKTPVTELTVGEDFTLEVEESKNVEAKVNDDATNKELLYESSNPSVAKVDSNGDVIAVGEGTAVITVKSKDNPELVETVTVTVVKTYKVTYAFIGDVIPEGVVAPVEKTYNNGTDVSVEAAAFAEGYTFSGWTTDDATVEDGKFIIRNDVHFVGSFSKDVKDIVVDKNDITLEIGDEDKITATVTPDDATDKEVIYKSSDETIVKVDKDGNIEAVGEGTATITVTSKENSEIKEEITVTVVKTYKVTYAFIGDVIPEGIVAPVEKTYNNGTDVSVEAAAFAEGYTFSGWTTDDATVEDGKFIIRNDVHFVGSFSKDVKDIVVDKNDITLEIGDEDKITATVTPDDATDKGVTFESSDETVVKVDENGNIEAVGEGTATITVTSEYDESIKETVTVTVKKPDVPVKDIVVEEDAFELEIGGKDKINVTVTPDDATDKGVTFESSDETVVRVDENGNIEAVGEGTATITVTSEYDESIKETVTVTVKKPQEPDTPDTPEEPEYVITVPEMLSLYTGETKNLGVTITPDDGTVKPVYKIENTDIATVDADGNVKALKVGVTTLSVDFGGGDIRVIPVRVTAAPVVTPEKTHYVCFGKTDGIGWYEVSVNGGDFFPQGPNSTLEVPDGAVLVVRVQDMWIDDEFDFYVNGSKVPLDPANTITVVVDGYMLIGALSMDVEVPDVEESLSLLDKIKNFFVDVINWFRNLFKR